MHKLKYKLVLCYFSDCEYGVLPSIINDRPNNFARTIIQSCNDRRQMFPLQEELLLSPNTSEFQ